jgi:small subunit ribosomal protein S5
LDILEKVIKVNRCTNVTKGGRKFSFSATVVVGNKRGSIGYGFGKANEIINAKYKAINKAKKNMLNIKLKHARTINHKVVSKFCSSKVIMIPAAAGTGIVASSTSKSLFEVLGVKDILVKSVSSNNPQNVIKAIILGLQSMK